MSIYGTFLTEGFVIEDEKNIDESESDVIEFVKMVKSNKKKFENEINNCCKNVYEFIKSSMGEEKGNYGNWKQELISKNNKSPRLEKLYRDSDIYQMQISFKSNTNHDSILFFEDLLVKELNKSSILKSMNLKFNNEDYPGIFIFYK